MAEDSELWDVICDRPFDPTKNLGDPAVAIPKTSKEIWEDLKIAHEGTTQVKQSKIDMLTIEYELFRMKDDEYIQDMHTRFTSTINELHSLGESIQRTSLLEKSLVYCPVLGKAKLTPLQRLRTYRH
ncbi:uncharacterized protein LOC107800008 [Nicotiana tabacum]|uniref:Uncharacterized protein LOC107800008 n=1 Tax=Nicotiana tabacum TaxID=4097 RepID=A0A1S4APZ7_TOBAC|nr:PREDICTED: uncharacterized protein LOC107800008 [Nicotiana tabacum]